MAITLDLTIFKGAVRPSDVARFTFSEEAGYWSFEYRGAYKDAVREAKKNYRYFNQTNFGRIQLIGRERL